MDIEKREKFESKFTDILNYGALNLAMAIGYETRLFDVMSDAGNPLSADEIAVKASVNRRYVQEWLGIMCTGGIVELVASDNGALYFLPPEHAAFLARSGDAGMCVYTQEIPLLTEIAMRHVVDDFSKAKGVPYECYPKFQQFMAELSEIKLNDTLIQLFLPCVDDGRLIERLQTGIRVCDLGCGQGIAVKLMAEHYPASTFVGIDNDAAAVKEARQMCESRGLGNVEFLEEDAALLKENNALKNRFDYILAFDAIHDQSHPLEALEGIRHMLAPGGIFSMVDIDSASDHAGNMDHPMAAFLYTVSLMHCMPVGLNDNGAGLGMMWGREKALAMLKEAGFENAQALEMEHDPFNLHYFCRG